MAIQRIQHGSTNGFQVRVGPRHASLTKFFSVRKYGGVRKALARAREVEAYLRTIAEPTTPRRGARRVAPANNTSGLVGIRARSDLQSEVPLIYFVASWSIRGKAYATSYSAQKHGMLGALTMAMERRERATGVRYDLTPRQAWNRVRHAVEAG